MLCGYIFTVVEGQVKGSVRCDTDDSLCNSTMYASRLLHGKLNLYDNGKYDEYKELLCKYVYN
jgi:hypothetical protein